VDAAIVRMKNGTEMASAGEGLGEGLASFTITDFEAAYAGRRYDEIDYYHPSHPCAKALRLHAAQAKTMCCYFVLGCTLISLILRRRSRATLDARNGGGGVSILGFVGDTAFRFVLDCVLADFLCQEIRREMPGRGGGKLPPPATSQERLLRTLFLGVLSATARKVIPGPEDLDESRSLWGTLWSIVQFVVNEAE